MDPDPDECMFCHEVLAGDDEDKPVNLAFMSHLRDREPCQDAFDVWTDNMASDHLG